MSNVFTRGLRAKLEEMMRSVTRLPGWTRRLGYYGLALLFVAAAATLRWALWDVLSPAPTLVFYLAWVGAAAFGGLGPGLLATVASWLCIDLFFDPTPGQIGFTDPMSIGRLVILLIGGLVISAVGEQMRRGRLLERRQGRELAVANTALREARDELEVRVQERTAELRQTMDLVESERQQFRNVLDQLPAYLVLLAPDYRVAFANRFFEQRFGRCEGRRCYEYLFQRTEPCASCEAYKVLKTNAPQHWEWAGPDGRDYDIYDFPFADADGAPLIMEVGLDITERKQAEAELAKHREHLEELVQERTSQLKTANEELHESEERLRQRAEEVETLMDLVPVGIWVAHDPQCDQITGNRAANSLYEAQEQENVSANVSPARRFFRGKQELKPEELPMQEAAARNIDIRDAEVDVLLPSGTWRNVFGSASPLHDAQGRVRGCIGAFMEITDRKQAEQALRERMKELACLYAVSRDKQEDLSLDELCRRAVEHLVPALQFPEITVPVIELNGKRFTSENYAEGLSHGLHAAIRVEGEVLGQLTVYYAEERPFIIPEEQNLLNGVAEALSTWLVRQRAEEALRESEQRYRKLFEASLAGAYLTKPDGTILDFNDAMMRMLGYDSREELFAHRSSDFYADPEFRQELIRLLQRDGIVPGKEAVLHRKDGSVLYALGSAVLLVDEQTGEPYIQGVAIDITERKHAEEALRRSEKQFKSTFENAAIGIAHVALDGHILQVNSRFGEIAGYPCADILGKTCEEITFADDWQAERAQMQRLLDGAVDHYAIEKRYLRMDGSPVWVNLTRSIQRDDTGQPEYFIVLVEDISARKRVEEALHELTTTLESKVAQRTAELKHRAIQLQKLTLDMSEAEDRERGRLAEILHDDLQQVLAAAKFQLGLLRSRVKHDASLQVPVAQIDQMLRDAIGKSRNLSHELSPGVLHHDDFAETLRWLASQVQAKHGLVVHVHTHGPVRLQSDAIKAFLYKTAQEMLFNVVKHARVNEARIRVRQCGRCICLSVSDRGRGFDPQELGEAAGFGLLSIRERIELLGGRMNIKSAKGKGSTFFIVVPESETAGTGSEVVMGSEGRAQGTGRGASQESGRLRVLLADDHRIVRQGLVALLSEEQTVEIVGEAANGREAVDLADRLEPDVVIMDVSMPLIDGDEATRQIKTHLPKTRVIALSMYDEPETMENMYKAGAESYVLKTASSEELLAALRGKESDS